MKEYKIGIFGEFGSFSEIAARKIYPKNHFLSYPTMKQVVESVIENQCQIGILPYFNSSTGIITPARKVLAYDLKDDSIVLKDNRIKKVDEISIPIKMNLLGNNDSKLEEIVATITHPNAVKQCTQFFYDFLPNCHIITDYLKNGIKKDYSTSLGAKIVRNTGSNNITALGSELLKDIYGLKIIADNIQNDKRNRTYFVTFEKSY